MTVEARFVWTEGSGLHIYLPEYHTSADPLCHLHFQGPHNTAPYDVLKPPKTRRGPCRRCFPHMGRIRQVEREGEHLEYGHARILQMYRVLEARGVYDIRDRITTGGSPSWLVSIRPPARMEETG